LVEITELQKNVGEIKPIVGERSIYLQAKVRKLIVSNIKFKKYIYFVKDSEKVEQSCVLEPSAMEKALMDPDDGCIYDPPYYANYIYKDFDSVSVDKSKIWIY
jgi:hypothetical protein